MPGWVIERVGRAITYLGDELRIYDYVHKSMAAMIIAPQLAAFVANEATIPELRMKAKIVSDWAALALSQISGADQEMVASHSFVSRWSAVEVGVEDSIVSILFASAAARDKAVLSGFPAITAVSPKRLSNQAKTWASTMKRTAGSHCAAWLAMLEALDVAAKVEPSVCDLISEAKAVRNCIVHRHATADTELLAEAPGSRWTVGEAITLQQDDLNRYTNAMSTFLSTLLGALGKSPYVVSTSVDGASASN
jgi:hypothetical protein